MPPTPTLQPTLAVLPTSVAIPTWTPQPTFEKALVKVKSEKTVKAVIQPSPVPTVRLQAAGKNRLGCLQASPDPFGAGGTYVVFCLKEKGNVIFRVFDSRGKLVRELEPTLRQAGRHQWLYDGKDQEGYSLQPGEYYYQVIARYEDLGHESRQSVFTRRNEKNQRR